jgi:hypothetical protein
MIPRTALESALVTRAFALQGAGLVWIVETGKLDVFLAPMESGSPAGALTHVVRVEEGGALFPLPLDPVSSLGFLAAPAAETVVQFCSPEDLSIAERNELSALWIKSIARQLPPVPEGLSLEQFHEWAATEWIARRRQAEQEHAERLSARTRADEKVVGAALRRLAQPFSHTGVDGAVGGAAHSPLAAACLAVGKAAGIELKIPPSVHQGTAKDPLRAIARFSAVRTRRLVLQGDWWKQDSGPMVAFLNADNRPVALLPRSVSGSGYDLFDPVEDTRVRVNRGKAGRLSGIAYVFYRPFPHRALSGWEVLRSGLQGHRYSWIFGQPACPRYAICHGYRLRFHYSRIRSRTTFSGCRFYSGQRRRHDIHFADPRLCAAPCGRQTGCRHPGRGLGPAAELAGNILS